MRLPTIFSTLEHARVEATLGLAIAEMTWRARRVQRLLMALGVGIALMVIMLVSRQATLLAFGACLVALMVTLGVAFERVSRLIERLQELESQTAGLEMPQKPRPFRISRANGTGRKSREAPGRASNAQRTAAA